MAREWPIPEHLVIVVADDEVDLRALETAGNTPKLRDVQRASEIPHAYWNAFHFEFQLLPTFSADSMDRSAQA